MDNNKIKLRNLDNEIVADIAARISGGSISNYNDGPIKRDIAQVQQDIMQLKRNSFDKNTDKIVDSMLDSTFKSSFANSIETTIVSSLVVSMSKLDASLQATITSLQTDVNSLKANSPAILKLIDDMTEVQEKVKNFEEDIDNIKKDITYLLSLDTQIKSVEGINDLLIGWKIVVDDKLVNYDNTLSILQNDVDKIKTKIGI